MKKILLTILPVLLLTILTACYDDNKDEVEGYNPLVFFTYTTGGENLATVTDCRLDAKNVVIPPTVNVDGKDYTVTAIYEETFLNHTNLQSVTFPRTLTEIGDRAFQGCTRLKSLVVPAQVSLGTAVFRGSGLVNVEVEEGVTVLPNQSFCECTSLSSVRLPSTLTDIKYMAFSNCLELKDVTDLATTPQRINIGGWPQQHKNATLHVPAGCLKAYDSWREYFKTIVDDAQ